MLPRLSLVVNWRSRLLAFVQHFPGLIIGSVAAGLVLSLIAIPIVAGVGLLVKDAVATFDELPDEIELPLLSQQNKILDKDGKLIATFFSENRISVPLEQISPVMRNAMIAIEDFRFYQHGAIDLQGTVRALITNIDAGSVEEGASTITQQLVQNIQISNAGGDAEAIREYLNADLNEKIQELKYAITLEQNYSKDEILEAYLNIAYFGSGTYGVEAAARYYFNTTAAELTLEQAALIAGIVARPVGYDPTQGDESFAVATYRRNTVIARMADIGMVAKDEAEAAMAKPIELNVARTPNGCYSTQIAAPLFCQYVRKVLETDPALGESQAERQAVLAEGGLTIRTTLDLHAQNAAQTAILDHVYPEDRAAGALAMVQPGDGAIRAMAQSKKLGLDLSAGDQTDLNLVVDADFGGGTIGYQPGSTMKPITAAAALNEGFTAGHYIYAPAFAPNESFGVEKDCNGEPVYMDHPSGGTSNFSSNQSRAYSMIGAIQNSVNNYFMKLTDQVGFCNVYKMAQQLGIHRANGEPLDKAYTFTLGINEVSPLTMASAYATFAARGVYCEPYAVVSIADRNGEALPVPEHFCEERLKPEIADTMNYMLANAVQSGTGTRARLDGGRPVAGKTGTTNSNLATSFVGFTPQLATAVAVWDPNGQGEENELRDVSIGGQHYRNVFGGSISAPIFKQAMDATLEGQEKLNFKRPPSSYLRVPRMEVPDVTGLSPDDAERELNRAGFESRFANEPVPSDVEAGRVARTDPAGGSRVTGGSTVTIFISSGEPEKPPGPPDPNETGPPIDPTDPPDRDDPPGRDP